MSKNPKAPHPSHPTLPQSPSFLPLHQPVPAVHHTLPFPFKALAAPPPRRKGEHINGSTGSGDDSDMAGLSVLLETHNSLPKYTHIISKTSLVKNSSLSSPPSSFATSPFLERCYLCRKKLQQGNDIYMYRGDRAFCSVECRCRQIFMDEESGRRDQCSLAAAAASAADAGAQSERGRPGRATRKARAVAGGFA
ncbi:unnamed protein product [Musa acuminata var. zebrina]